MKWPVPQSRKVLLIMEGRNVKYGLQCSISRVSRAMQEAVPEVAASNATNGVKTYTIMSFICFQVKIVTMNPNKHSASAASIQWSNATEIG